MTVLNGIVGSQGYGSGAAVVKRQKVPDPARYTIDNVAAEKQRFRDAQATCDARMIGLLEDSVGAGDEAAEIIKAYLVILRDEAFFKKALDRLEPEMANIEYLIWDECQKVMAQFAALDDPYLRERAVDIENVCNELIRTMLGLEYEFFIEPKLGNDIVVVASDLTPAETMKMDKSYLRGFVTEKGGATSHTVILAKALGIPAVTGVEGVLEAVSDGDFLLLDAFCGEVTVNPDPVCKAAFQARSSHYCEKQKQYAQNASQPAVTLDGFRVDVNINTGDAESMRAFDCGACDGVGLFRTEFIYMNHSGYPDEETQYAIYSGLAAKAGGKEVIIRTLDIGGDKQLGYMCLPREENPFLGYRAIRLCLDRQDVFLTQLRAILRAAVHGNVKIMFPMIVNTEELRQAKGCVEKAKESLARDGLPFRPDIPIGIMVETPAAVLLSDKLAQEADFFSIGSNDLIQYTTATDRMNERVQHLYDSCNLSVLRSIHMVAESAKKASIPWGICGEVASEDRLIPVWVAMGVSELSVSPSLVPKVKHLIRQVNKAQLTPEVGRVLAMSGIDEVKRELGAILSRLEGIS